jgi:hypothetical protein
MMVSAGRRCVCARRPMVCRMAGERVTVEILYFEACPHHEDVLARLRSIIAEHQLDARVVLKRVESGQTAQRERFLGSPTVRINGQDVDPSAATRTDYGLKCRLYPCGQRLVGDIPDDLLLAALGRAHA